MSWADHALPCAAIVLGFNDPRIRPRYTLLRDSNPPKPKITGEETAIPRSLISLGIPAMPFLVSIIVAIFPFSKPQTPCTNPCLRPEWQALNPVEKLSYLWVAQCLTRTSSTTPDLNTTVHDEMSRLHAGVDNYCAYPSVLPLHS
ncbi:hypothetical protein BDV06DRAFT_190902 [Aspergillus oleicola]